MRFNGDAVASATLLSFLLPFAAADFSCAEIKVDRHTFDMSKLSGPHAVQHSLSHPPSSLDTTYTIDICKPLIPEGSNKDERCPDDTQVCAIQRLINPTEKTDTIFGVIPISRKNDLRPSFTALNKATTSDSQGFRAILNGGSYSDRAQRAIIDFICAPDLEGTEGEAKPHEGDGYKSNKREEHNSTALTFVSYGANPNGPKDTDTLMLEWQTKYACESLGDGSSNGSSHWGFFTWFIIILFMSTAAYLIMGSWVNYNRYGSRGWEALPHSDTIRDLPYLMKDWGRSVFSTVQDTGTRGGYSAV